MFRGRFAHTVDSKGRVSIPAGFRVELQRRSDRAPILTNAHQCLYLYAHEDWTAFEQRLVGLSSVNPNYDAFRRFFISGASECSVDNQGRLLIPPVLREDADLKREVMIAGVGERIEIWDKPRFDAEIARTKARYSEIASEVAKLGT